MIDGHLRSSIFITVYCILSLTLFLTSIKSTEAQSLTCACFCQHETNKEFSEPDYFEPDIDEVCQSLNGISCISRKRNKKFIGKIKACSNAKAPMSRHGVKIDKMLDIPKQLKEWP